MAVGAMVIDGADRAHGASMRWGGHLTDGEVERRPGHWSRRPGPETCEALAWTRNRPVQSVPPCTRGGGGFRGAAKPKRFG